MSSPATILGVPLSLISLVTLTVQNSALTIVLHYSRISVAKDKMYSAASAVLLNELLKGAISLSIAFRNAVHAHPSAGDYAPLPSKDELEDGGRKLSAGGGADNVWESQRMQLAAKKLFSEIFSNDCWKLSIPACLYVIQNNLQFVAASNLDVPTFQVTYNLKILTTALFSVVLLRRRLSAKKWFALLFLAAGVGVVQLQSTAAAGGGGGSKGSHGDHDMDKFKGLLAVGAACMTSGLAGVYFEMVLKGSKADLWCRNVQLSFFSLLPALFAVFAPGLSLTGGGGGSATSTPPVVERQAIFANFGGWAWSVVLIQVFGGLVTALVIRYSDNIMKGFATSLAIVLSFVAGVILFEFQVTASFLVGTAMVVTATYLYNLPDTAARRSGSALPSSNPSTPSSLPSTRNFSIPSSMGGYPLSLASSSSSLEQNTYPPTSPAFAIHSSNANPVPASGGPAYRRPTQHLPPGAQTPDVNLAFQNFSPLEHATAPSGGGGPVSPPNSVPNSVSHSASSSYSRSTTPIPQVSSRVVEGAGAGAGGEGGISSGMDRPSVPGSPDPKRRGVGANKWS